MYLQRNNEVVHVTIVAVGKQYYIYSQTPVHERLESWTIRFTNKFSEHKASRMTYCVSSYEHASGAKRQEKEKESPSKQ